MRMARGNHLRSLYALICASVLAASAAGDAPRLVQVEHLTVEDGLTHSTVWDVLQDRRGFLWFATVNALQRYDGYELETYRHDPEDPDSISSSEVMTMVEDRDGQLWLATRQGGLDRFDRTSDRFVHHRHDPADPHSLTGGTSWVMIEDRAGFLWIGGARGLNRFDRVTGEVTRFVHDPDRPASLSSEEVFALAEDGEGVLSRTKRESSGSPPGRGSTRLIPAKSVSKCSATAPAVPAASRAAGSGESPKIATACCGSEPTTTA